MLLWTKYKFFKAGISPHEFRKCRMRDIIDIMEINNAMDTKMAREQKIKEMIARMG